MLLQEGWPSAHSAMMHCSTLKYQSSQRFILLQSALQETKVNESSLINSLRASLAVNEEATDAACQQSRLDAQAAHDLQQKLQQAKQAKLRSQQRLGMLGDMLTFTRRERDQAEERLATAHILISSLDKSLTRAQHDRGSNANQCDVLSAQLAEALSAKKAAEAQLEQLHGTVNRVTAQLSQAVSSQIAADARAKAENAELSFQMKVSLARREVSEQQVQQLKSENADLSRQLADALAGQAAAHTQVQQLKSEKADLSWQLADALAGKAAAHTQVQQLQGSNSDLTAQLADAVSGKAAAEQHVQQLQELADAVSSKAAAEQQLHCVTVHNKEVTAQLADAMSDKAAAAKDAQRVVSDRQSLYTQLADAVAYLAGTAGQLQQVKADRDSMSDKLAAAVALQQDSEKCLSDYKGQVLKMQKQLTATEQEVVKCAGDREQLSDAHAVLEVSFSRPAGFSWGLLLVDLTHNLPSCKLVATHGRQW